MNQLQLTILLVILSFMFSSGQSNCDCNSKPDYKSFISCDTITFNNGAKLYRQFNCDSSWLTFETINCDEVVLFSLNKDLIDLTPRLGYHFVKEYSKLILFENKQASGGGYPTNYLLINKDSGEIFKRLGPILFYSEDQTREIIVTLINDPIPLFSFYNLKTNLITKYPVSIEENEFTRFMSNEMFPENHFENALLTKDTFEIEYSYKIDDKNKWHKTKILIDIKDNNNR